MEAICASAGVAPVRDPSNEDDRFERVRVRRALGQDGWLDAGAVAKSAANLAEADEALRWAAEIEWGRAVDERRDRIVYRPSGAPSEILRRIVSRAVRKLATEGESELRGSEIDRLVASLSDDGTTTLRGVLCTGGSTWRFERAPARRA